MKKHKPKPCDFNHLILYAKNWYKKTDFLGDIRTILAHRCGLSPAFLTDADVWALLVHACEEYLSEYDKSEIFTRMFSTSWVDGVATNNPFAWEGSTSWLRPAKMIVSKLGCLQVKGVLELGDLDPKILPLAHIESKQKYKKLKEGDHETL